MSIYIKSLLVFLLVFLLEEEEIYIKHVRVCERAGMRSFLYYLI